MKRKKASTKPTKKALPCKFCGKDMPKEFEPALDDQICEDCQEEREQQAARGELKCKNCHEDMPDDFNTEVDDPVCDDCHWAMNKMYEA